MLNSTDTYQVHVSNIKTATLGTFGKLSGTYRFLPRSLMNFLFRNMELFYCNGWNMLVLYNLVPNCFYSDNSEFATFACLDRTVPWPWPRPWSWSCNLEWTWTFPFALPWLCLDRDKILNFFIIQDNLNQFLKFF